MHMPDNPRLKLSQDKIQSIADEYCKGSTSVELADKYDVSYSTILRYLRELDCKVRSAVKPTKYSQDTIKRIVDDYCKGSSSIELAKKYDISPNTILNYVRELGCEVRSALSLAKYSEDTIKQIVDEYCKDLSSRELAKKYDVDYRTILRYVRKLGCKVRSRSGKVSE